MISNSQGCGSCPCKLAGQYVFFWTMVMQFFAQFFLSVTMTSPVTMCMCMVWFKMTQNMTYLVGRRGQWEEILRLCSFLAVLDASRRFRTLPDGLGNAVAGRYSRWGSFNHVLLSGGRIDRGFKFHCILCFFLNFSDLSLLSVLLRKRERRRRYRTKEKVREGIFPHLRSVRQSVRQASAKRPPVQRVVEGRIANVGACCVSSVKELFCTTDWNDRKKRRLRHSHMFMYTHVYSHVCSGMFTNWP